MDIKTSFRWIRFVSNRFSRVDKKGRSAVTGKIASLGVGLGVMTLIVVMSVMNGFQLSFIDSIMEISSFHVRITQFENIDALKNEKLVRCVVPFKEAQGLVVGRRGDQCSAIIRAVPKNVMDFDQGFKKELKIIGGRFDLEQDDYIVIGSSLAHSLGANIGSKINILALSGSSDVSLLSQNRTFVVKGIFHCGYQDINQAYAFINYDSGMENFGSNSPVIYGVKLNDQNQDNMFCGKIKNVYPDCRVQSWREFNRSFFGALRMEKNILLLLVLLIFVVVAINIFNGMRRLVWERKEEIAVLSALGAEPWNIRAGFLLQGLTTGLKGTIPGLAAGLFFSINIKNIFVGISKVLYWVQYAACFVFNPARAGYVSENPMFAVYAAIPARILLPEVIMICLFGIFSAFGASWLAGRDVLKLTVSEVLRNE